MAETLWTPGATTHELARQQPEETAVYLQGMDGRVRALSRRELDLKSSQLSHALAERGVKQGDMVAIVLPNGFEHVIATLAAYKLGACPTPVSERMPPAERDALLELARPAAVIAGTPDLGDITTDMMANLAAYSDSLPQEAVPQPAKAIASGGSTGKPKLIVSPGAFAYPWQQHPLAALMDIQPGDRLFSPGPLYHNQAFFFSQIALFQGASIAINERFEAARALDFIEQHKPTILSLVPTMMQRMLREPGFSGRDLSSLRRAWHMAAPCPDWAKLGWIEAIGAERVWELWAATEVTGVTTINGEEWLQRRGSVGRGFNTELRILDENGQACESGAVGEIYSRFGDGSPQYEYRGAEALQDISDGFRSVGDMGYLDADGYLYLADRRVDLIISGGANVYPAEVEAVLSEHPQVADAVVIGLPDADLGRRVHAIIESEGAAPDVESLAAHCAARLARYKLPRSFEIVRVLPRNEAGKLRRGALRAEREKSTQAQA